MTVALSIILTAFILGILITIHEFGHFAAGKLLGFTITEFAIGMGPKIFKKHKHGTDFVLRAFPIGGMCKFVGEDEEVVDAKSFNAHPVWKRMITVAAGAFMNILLAFLVGALLFGIFGSNQPIAYENPQISSVSEGAPAENSGLMAGDFVVAINSNKVENTTQMIGFIKAVEENYVDISVLRPNENTIFRVDGEVVDIENSEELEKLIKSKGGIQHSLTIENADLIENIRVENIFDSKAGYNKIGVSISDSTVLNVRHGFFGSFTQSANFFVTTCDALFDFLGQLFTGKADIKQMMGIIGIVDVLDSGVSEVANLDVDNSMKASFIIEYLLLLLVLLSINLGVVNLLPFPALDCGRLVFMLIELV
ncbi:MAG: PDZ domain-containing protein, partial [Clostridiales bacterium]|nr:PDZ domain-containing protein [Clostridiales bacterium]